MEAVSEGALQCPSDAMDWNFQIYHFPLQQMYVNDVTYAQSDSHT